MYKKHLIYLPKYVIIYNINDKNNKKEEYVFTYLKRKEVIG